jgi:GntR family transcriptional repressor for pyruvate dehydrogenase complex
MVEDREEPGYRKVATILEHRILDGQLAPGSLLPTEGRLVAEFGMNRSTIREGLRALESAGLVRRIDTKRMVVSVPDRSITTRSTMRAIGLSQFHFQELWEALLYFEPFAAELAAHRMSAGLEPELRRNIEEMRAHIDDDERIIQLDIEFHQLVGEATTNRVLALSHEPICRLLYSATKKLYQRVPAARHRMLKAHRTIYEAITVRDSATARTWMAKHIRDFHRGYVLAGLELNVPVEFIADDVIDRVGSEASGVK